MEIDDASETTSWRVQVAWRVGSKSRCVCSRYNQSIRIGSSHSVPDA